MQQKRQLWAPLYLTDSDEQPRCDDCLDYMRAGYRCLNCDTDNYLCPRCYQERYG